MNFILFDDSSRKYLLPLTFTRPVADIRIGILTIREKWERLLQAKTSSLTEPYLSKKFLVTETDDNILIAGSVIPNPSLVKDILQLKPGDALWQDKTIIALRTNNINREIIGKLLEDPESDSPYKNVQTSSQYTQICHVYDIFTKNDEELRKDFTMITAGRKSQPIGESNTVLNPSDIFIEEGAVIEGAVLNAKTGPIYVGKDAEIMEGSVIRGPFSLGEHAQVKMGSRIYGATTIGHYSKIGGELNNVVIFGYSNKAHDGFLGNSVLGEWCNLGADTNVSNLKNSYDNVRLWSYVTNSFANTGLQFCGLVMGDHSKCGISTMINTGTVMGVNVNVYGSGYHRNFVASFSFGSPGDYTDYVLEKAILTAERVYQRRDKVFDDIEKEIFRNLYEMTDQNRRLAR